MRIVEKELFNELIAEESKSLVNREEYQSWLETNEEERQELYKTDVAIIPKTLTLEKAQELFLEIEN